MTADVVAPFDTAGSDTEFSSDIGQRDGHQFARSNPAGLDSAKRAELRVRCALECIRGGAPAHLAVEVSAADLAAITGCNAQTVRRALNKWQKSGHAVSCVALSQRKKQYTIDDNPKRFIRVPRRLGLDPRIDGHAAAIMLALCSRINYADPKKGFMASLDWLVDRTHMDRKRAVRAIHDLEACGFLKVSRTRRPDFTQAPNWYFIVWDSPIPLQVPGRVVEAKQVAAEGATTVASATGRPPGSDTQRPPASDTQRPLVLDHRDLSSESSVSKPSVENTLVVGERVLNHHFDQQQPNSPFGEIGDYLPTPGRSINPIPGAEFYYDECPFTGAA